MRPTSPSLPFVLAAAIALGIVLWFGVDVPQGDDWDTPGAILANWAQGDTLELAHFTAKHNETRPVVPRLLSFGLALAVGWHPKLQMLLSWACGVAMALGLRSLLPTAGRPRGAAALAAWALALFLFSPLQFQNQLWGIQLVVFLPPACLVGCLALACTRRPAAQVFAGCAVLALVATYSYAHGALVWVLGWPVPLLWLRARAGLRPVDSVRGLLGGSLVHAVCAVLALLAYVAGPEGSPWGGDGSAAARDATAMAAFFATWAGSFLSFGSPEGAGPVGVVVLLAVGGTLATLAARATRDQDLRLLARAWPFLALLAYGLLSGLAAAWARGGLGAEAALAWRYRSFSVWIPLGLTGLVFLSTSARGLARAPLLALVLVALLGWWYGIDLAASHAHASRRTELNVRLLEQTPGNAELVRMYPLPKHVIERVAVLRPSGLLPGEPIGPWLGDATLQPGEPAPGSWRRRMRPQRVDIEGDARLPDGRLPDFVLVARRREEGPVPWTGWLVDEHGRFEDHLPRIARRPTPDLALFAVDVAARSLHEIPIAGQRPR